MKMIIAFAALLAIALAAPQGQPPASVVNEIPLDNIGVDGYKFGFELSDGGSRRETAVLKNVGTEQEALEVTGSYTYVDPVTQQKYTVNYIANENGFQPEGAHIPV